MLYLIPIIAMLYLIPIIVIFNSNNCHAILNSDNCHAIFGSGIHHAIVDTNICHVTLIWYHDSGTWYLHRYSIYRPGTRYDILDTCTWHTVYDMLLCGTNTWTWHHDSWPGTTTPDTCVLYDIFMTITFTGTWHDYYIITRYFVLLNSCTPVYLNPWNREAPDITPDIILLLTP